MSDFTPQEAQVLTRLQRDLPVALRPFAVIGEELGMAEETVLAIACDLSARGFIRELSGLFDTRALGYTSVLVAAQIDSDLDAAAAIISAHPGVSHNYAREGHAFNLWFTLALPPDSRLGLERTLAILQRLTGARRMEPLPALRTFKLNVLFDLSGDSEAAVSEAAAPTAPPTADDIALVRLLQQPFPLVAEPYAVLGEPVGLPADALLDGGRALYAKGYLRRIAAVLRHRKVGFAANGMGVWDVPDDRVEEVGAQLAQYPEVSHCYQRPRVPGWPYNLFTMVHARSQEECTTALARMAAAVGLPTPPALFSTKEYKKARVRYFAPELAVWEAEHGADTVE
jgi:DNA-binding Lrp family transcriptional regulator